MKNDRLLELDGIGNILLGLPFVAIPGWLSQFLGLSVSDSFYPVILGAVFIGIGIALLLERFKPEIGGLAIGGAISINLTFALVLGIWLLTRGADLLIRGQVIFALLFVILVGISLSELIMLRKTS